MTIEETSAQGTSHAFILEDDEVTCEALAQLKKEEASKADPHRKDMLQWQIKILTQALEQFPNVEDMYQAHKQSTLHLVILKYEHDKHFQELLLACAMEELGGYKHLIEDEINGKAHLDLRAYDGNS